MQRQDGTPFYAQLKSLARRDSDTDPFSWRLALIDLTAQRQQAEAQLAWSAAIVDFSHDAIIGTMLDGSIVSWNAGAVRMYGYAAAEVVGRSITLLAPLQRRNEFFHLTASLQHNIAVKDYETQRLHKDGSQLEVSLTYSLIKDRHGGVIGISVINRDITLRTQHEAQLNVNEQALRQSQAQLRRLVRHQQQRQEQERAAMAREIHDELAQTLTSLHMDIAWLSTHLSSTPATHERLQAITSQVHDLDTAAHRIAMELHPRLLDDLGLLAAIEWQLEDVQRRVGLLYALQVPAAAIPLEPARATALFRVFQEALSNVVRHAQASQVTVRIVQDPKGVCLSVIDNGKGIPPARRRERTALGLLGMHERARLWDGKVTIKGSRGKGTTVTVRMPCQAVAQPGASL
jgi:PAS domain S-box-containing protein